MSDAPELKPCPFCGSHVVIERGSDHHGEWFNLGCSNHWGVASDPDKACIGGRLFYIELERTEAQAIEAWNTRRVSCSQTGDPRVSFYSIGPATNLETLAQKEKTVNDAPEHIWASTGLYYTYVQDWTEGEWSVDPEHPYGAGDSDNVKYTRTDLCDPMQNLKVKALVEAIQGETDALGVLVAGLEPKRQYEIQNGSLPVTQGEKIWACVMRLHAALERSKK